MPLNHSKGRFGDIHKQIFSKSNTTSSNLIDDVRSSFNVHLLDPSLRKMLFTCIFTQVGHANKLPYVWDIQSLNASLLCRHELTCLSTRKANAEGDERPLKNSKAGRILDRLPAEIERQTNWLPVLFVVLFELK